eukprot:gene7451-9157_t
MIERAVEEKVNLFCLPENFAFCSSDGQPFETRDNAEFLDQKDGVIEKFRALAKQHSIWLSLGGFHQKIKDNPDKIYNTHIIINSEGNIVTTYNKMHLFDVDIPSKGIKFTESKIVKPGDEIVVCDSPLGCKLGLTVCYDLRFPELFLSLALKQAQIILVPAAFMKRTGEAHWKPLLQARAIENQVYIVAAAQTGKHHEKRESYGHSMIIDPWGTVLSEIDPSKEEEIAICDIDLHHLSNVRQNIPVFQHRKPINYKTDHHHDQN